MVVGTQLHTLVPLLLKHLMLFYTLKMFFVVLNLLQTCNLHRNSARIIVASLNQLTHIFFEGQPNRGDPHARA
jgi:hypothetical protein